MSYNAFDRRTMLQALEQRLKPKSFLLDTFFPKSKTFDTKVVDLDVKKGKRRLAPFVAPVHEGKVITKDGFVTQYFEPPYIKMKRPSTAAELLQRGHGNTIYDGETIEQRAARLMGDDLAEMDDMITRREEWMAAQVLNTGAVTCSGDGIAKSVDFGMDATHKITLAGNDLWSATSTATPLDDLAEWSRLVAKDSGIMPTICVMGADAWNAFRNFYLTSGKASPLSPIKITLGEIQPKNLPSGASFMGSIFEAGMALDIYTYFEYYLDDNGDTQSMVPAKKVWLGTPNAYTARLYGAILDMKAKENFAVARFPKTWEEEDPSVVWVMLQSSPIVSLLQPDAFLSAQVLS